MIVDELLEIVTSTTEQSFTCIRQVMLFIQ